MVICWPLFCHHLQPIYPHLSVALRELLRFWRHWQFPRPTCGPCPPS